jgi:hypothetical protein
MEVIMVLYLNVRSRLCIAKPSQTCNIHLCEGQRFWARQYYTEGSNAWLFWNMQGEQILRPEKNEELPGELDAKSPIELGRQQTEWKGVIW